MSNHNKLLFFNKEGDYLNFKYNDQWDRFEGNLIFDQNSTDTFRTIGLYTLEKIDSFEFESPGELSLNKFQLFNEFGLFFYRSGGVNEQISKIEPVNNDPTFYSKWIYGNDFEKKFPIGTIIIFESPLLEFTNLTQTYTVVSTKKGAIMIITSTDNATFDNTYFADYNSTATYFGTLGVTFSIQNPPPSPIGKKISAINAVGVYNYIDSLYNDNLSTWNEPSFYDKLYPRKKLNVYNSQLNDGVYTVVEENLTDNKHYEYFANTVGINNDLIIEVISKTDLPKVYDGGLNFTNQVTQLTTGGEILTFTFSSNTGTDNFYVGLTSSSNLSVVSGSGASFDVSVSGGIVTSVIINSLGIDYSQGNVFIIDGSFVGGSSVSDDVTIYINSVYGSITTNEGRIYFSDPIPPILKPGREFKVIGSINNSNFLQVKSLPTYNGIAQARYYATQSQVIWNNLIYECVQAYTQSYSLSFVDVITPNNNSYWTSSITHIKVEQELSPENLVGAQIYLTTDRVYFQYGFTVSNQVTLASAAEKYRSDLTSFNIDLFYDSGRLKADLMYPSKYAEVNFYANEVGPSFSIGSVTQTYERVIRVREQMKTELNYDYSERNSYKIVFTDLDLYGFKLKINKQFYEEELAPIFSGGSYDVQRTIDRTLRNWLIRYYTELVRIGINAEVTYVGSVYSPFVNCIKLTSTYPNVPMALNEVLVGTTADYHIEHSSVLFNQDISNNFYGLGNSLTITINNDEYDVPTTYQTGSFSQYPDISATLQDWVDEYADFLRDFGIIVSNINNLLKFDVKRLDRRLVYSINVGKFSLPGQNNFIITDKLKGNLGPVVASNEITLPQSSQLSFESSGFATGMIVSINNTIWPYDNIEYNIQLVDPGVMNLSYQGPFWGLTSGICDSSAFITLAFDLGFGQTACPPIIGPTSSIGGPFNSLPGGAFNTSAFSLSYNPNTYILNTYDLEAFPGTTGLVDLIYVQLSNSIYAFGDNLVVMDSYLSSYITTIILPGNTQSIEIEFNEYNNYLYCLSKNMMFVVDPLLNYLVATMSLIQNAVDMEINPTNGDIYVTYESSPNISIFDFNNNLATTLGTSSTNFPPLATSCGKMVFNDFEKDMYVVTNASEVLRINGGGFSNGTNRTIQTTYGIPGLTNSIFYEPVNESIYVFGSSSLFRIDNGVATSLSINTQTFDDIIFNNLTLEMNMSDSSTSFRSLNLFNNTVSIDTGVSNYGYLALNQFDGDVYLSSLSTNNILVIRPTTGAVVHTEPLPAGTTRIIYNPDRQSVWTIQPSLNSIVELDVILNSSIIINPPLFEVPEENLYGTLSPDYVPRPDMWLKTREYVRRPRENFEGESRVQYYYTWYSDNIPEIFMYDFSGDQLPTSGPYAYTGAKPLSPAVLSSTPNRNLEKVDASEYQQTIFKRINYNLSYVDDEDDITTEPSPLQLFMGFKSDVEGAIRSLLLMYKREDVEVTYTSTELNDVILTFETEIVDGEDRRGRISINSISSEFFIDKGLKEGQRIVIYVRDVTNTKSQYISLNNGLIVSIRSVFSKTLIVDFLNKDFDSLVSERTVISDYPKVGKTTYLKVDIKVIDREIGRFFVFGQTEEEDIRFKTELGNQGKLIAPDEVFIFKEYDINEGGIDWTILNKRRKEMLMMRSSIYPYIGAYKSIINAINFFGYNDLQLNEYYKDINPRSEKFLKLFKVEIPDIFDNTVEGFTETEYLKNNFPNENYEETNLFNLTYFITDKEGNNKLNYSIDEVIIKLQGLKYWLKRNIIPLTHKILDISGVAYFNATNQITHTSYDAVHFKTKQNMTPVTFKLNETYLMPVNSGSTVYNCVLDFYSIREGIGADKDPLGLNPPPKPYNGVDLDLPDYFTIDVRTYKTYNEWVPFNTYLKGEKVTYFSKLYESAKDNNKINNPRKYENVSNWRPDSTYLVTNIVKYERDFYVLSGLGFYSTASSTASFVSSTSPLFDSLNWKNITEWREIDYEPVQKLSEYRKIPRGNSQSMQVDPINFPNPNGITYSNTGGNAILPFNFTIDSNIDPFIVIEITSDNGYGLVYRDKKNYEIRGLKDIRTPNKVIDQIGPFEPISIVY